MIINDNYQIVCFNLLSILNENCISNSPSLIKIDREFARGERNSKKKTYYEFLLIKQDESDGRTHPTLLLFKTRKKWVSMYVHSDGRLEMDSKEYTVFYNETDSLDRLIIIECCYNNVCDIINHNIKNLKNSAKYFSSKNISAKVVPNIKRIKKTVDIFSTVNFI